MTIEIVVKKRITDFVFFLVICGRIPEQIIYNKCLKGLFSLA
jgi:hypothetical protein